MRRWRTSESLGDNMPPSLDDLCSCIRPLVDMFLARAASELGFDMDIVNVIRTPAQQAQNIANGVSWTKISLHEPQPVCQKSHAIDAAPKHLIVLPHWAPENPDWKCLRDLGVSCGLLAGFDWKQRDEDHYEVRVIHDPTTFVA